MIKIKQAVIVEGKYDKIKLSSIIDGLIIETDGFGIFKDKEKQNYAVVVKVPALLTAARKMADLGEDAASMSFRGVLYPNDNVIIYDLSKGEPVKRRGKRKPKNNEEEKGQAAEE